MGLISLFSVTALDVFKSNWGCDVALLLIISLSIIRLESLKLLNDIWLILLFNSFKSSIMLILSDLSGLTCVEVLTELYFVALALRDINCSFGSVKRLILLLEF